MQNGAVININNTIDGANVILGGTSSLAGGTGTLNMSGGSSINFTGPAASASLQVGGVERHGLHDDDRRQHRQRRCDRHRERRRQRRNATAH